MGRHGVTLEDVTKAIQKLSADGKHPTIDAIRQAIGSGSKTTITRHLHTLKTHAEPELISTVNSPSGQSVPPEVLNLVSALWEKMQSTTPPSPFNAVPNSVESSEKRSPDASLVNRYNSLQQAHDLVTRQLQVRLRAFGQLEQKLAQQQQLLTAYEQEIKQKNLQHQELARRAQILASDLQQAKISIHHLQQ